MTKLYIIDANAYVHRAYHALPPLTNSKGEMVNAVYGFIRMILKLLKQEKPEYLIVAFDYPARTFRHDKYPEYKATRKEIDDALKHQMPLAREAANALNLSVVEKQGFEADDIIATLARQARKDKAEVVIVSGDKDARQLVENGITVWDEAKNISYNTDKVIEKYGIEPKQLVDMFALMGDASDNVPGIKGVGEKTATKLVKEFGSVENLLKNTSKLEGKLKTLIEEKGGDAEKSKDLIRLHEQVPLDITWKDGRIKPLDDQKLEEFLKKMEFKSLIKELIPGSSAEIEKEEAEHKEISKAKYKTNIIFEEKELSRLIEEIREKCLVSIDLETTSTDEHKADIVGFSFALNEKEAYYLPVRHKYLNAPKQIPLETAIRKLKEILEDAKIKKCGQNIKYDMLVLKHGGIELGGIYFDSMVASYCINPSRASHGLKNLALDYTDFKMTEIEELIGKGAKQVTMAEVEIQQAAEYACADAVTVMMLKEKFEPELKEKKLEKLFYDLEMPLINILAEMEYFGIRVDMPLLEKLATEFSHSLKKIEKDIYRLAGKEFNINSPKQLSVVLFEELKLPILKKTKTGYSTDEEVLNELSEKHELPAKLLEHRELQKLKSTYIDSLMALADKKTSRVHTSFNQAVTATGRLSSSEPNLQNIPIRSEYGKQIRSVFISEKGCTLLSADYSQIDLRMLAHISGDQALIKAFKDGEDIHSATARDIFGVTEKSVTPEQRRFAKTINFGIIYGLSPYGLSQQLKIPATEARNYIDKYFKKYKGVKEWMDELLKETRVKGYVTTLFGRIRYLPDINSKNARVRGFAERMAMNTPIQGSSADIIKIAMINLDRHFRKEEYATKMLVQVHDELLFETPDKELHKTAKLAKTEMEAAMKLKVPVIVDLKSGPNWAEMNELQQIVGSR